MNSTPNLQSTRGPWQLTTQSNFLSPEQLRNQAATLRELKSHNLSATSIEMPAGYKVLYYLNKNPTLPIIGCVADENHKALYIDTTPDLQKLTTQGLNIDATATATAIDAFLIEQLKIHQRNNSYHQFSYLQGAYEGELCPLYFTSSARLWVHEKLEGRIDKNYTNFFNNFFKEAVSAHLFSFYMNQDDQNPRQCKPHHYIFRDTSTFGTPPLETHCDDDGLINASFQLYGPATWFYPSASHSLSSLFEQASQFDPSIKKEAKGKFTLTSNALAKMPPAYMPMPGFLPVWGNQTAHCKPPVYDLSTPFAQLWNLINPTKTPKIPRQGIFF